MSWKLAIPLGLALSTAAVPVLIYAEAHAPLQLKPSILLRASTGDVPTTDFAGLFKVEDDRARKVQEDMDALARRGISAKAVRAVTVGAIDSLKDRIQEKQTTGWEVSVPAPQ